MPSGDDFFYLYYAFNNGLPARHIEGGGAGQGIGITFAAPYGEGIAGLALERHLDAADSDLFGAFICVIVAADILRAGGLADGDLAVILAKDGLDDLAVAQDREVYAVVAVKALGDDEVISGGVAGIAQTVVILPGVGDLGVVGDDRVVGRCR